MTGKHECAAHGCKFQISNAYLMCRKHWMQVPKPLRDAIYDTFGRRDWPAYTRNVREAQRMVVEREIRRELRAYYSAADIEIWMAHPHMLLGGMSPVAVIADGRSDEVRQVIEGMGAGVFL